MKIIDIIKKRRSIREFLDKQVEFHKIVDVIEAGMHAPSAGNLQNWKFIIVKDKNSICKRNHDVKYYKNRGWRPLFLC